MKTISFSAVEILPALLNKKKTQTIRPAWKKEWIDCDPECGNPCLIDHGSYEIPKSPRLSVGDKVRLYWEQRSKFKEFCRKCGEKVTRDKGVYRCVSDCFWVGNYDTIPPEDSHVSGLSFNKILGEVEITEVFEIEMVKKADEHYSLKAFDRPGSEMLTSEFMGDKTLPLQMIYSKDGFKSAEDMFKWFNNQYDLSKAMPLYVYRWKWLK